MTQTTERSTRLRSDVALYPGRDGYVLRTDAGHHHVHLAPSDVDTLLDALATGAAPATAPARSALDSLIGAGLVDPPAPRHRVTGEGQLASALRSAMARMGVPEHPDGRVVVAQDHPEALPSDERSCWISDGRVLLSPPGVPAAHVAARHRAATLHRDLDPLTSPTADGRRVSAASSNLAAALELAAVTVVAELLARDRPAHEAVVIDLDALTVQRRPVLPVPAPPR